MADEAYKKAFRTAMQARMKKLFMTHLVIYLVVNIVWLAINYMMVIPAINEAGATPLPVWQPWFSPIGWGICIVIHYMTYVSGGEKLIMEVEAEAER
ncbi:MAG TPA: 2TM domain-containing protein [Methanothrix sp.]|nr:2TM domain-containing protein [Methanothrix sp.]HPJ84154.1 2TM domain-containing protein [Methanothrix sp.]HPR65636.1 2TM domain-containing protein [Methanothrix sp.]